MSRPDVLTFALMLGFLVGLRSATPPAVMAWVAHIGSLKLHHPFLWLATTWAAVIFTLLAVIEIVDSKERNPASVPRMIFAVVAGAFLGACVASVGEQPFLSAVILGIAGAIIGIFSHLKVRSRKPRVLAAPDYVISVIEDIVAIGGSVLIISRL